MDFGGRPTRRFFRACDCSSSRSFPQDPSRPAYRQGASLGPARKHWFRAKFGGQRFRLFFRYSMDAKIIIFGWVNDESTLRTHGSKSDAYAVFRGMLDAGDPPDDWASLLKAAKDREAALRFASATRSGERNT